MYTSVCVKISRSLGYTIDEVLDKTVDWVNLMIEEITRQEVYENAFNMSLHGFNEDAVKSYISSNKNNSVKVADPRAVVAEFGGLGFKKGKPSGTTIIRPEHKKGKKNG